MNKYQVAIIGTNIGAKHYEDFQKVSDKLKKWELQSMKPKFLNGQD